MYIIHEYDRRGVIGVSIGRGEVNFVLLKLAFSQLWEGKLIAVLLSVGGNRTNVTIPKDILTTIALYRSAIEVLIEFDNEMYAYSYDTSITGICVHLV